ncbi:hypothetical protein ACFVYT_41590 [Streptomyces sp. NPDC058290]|uniref:hypothetical protein n=1 Tax=Streptomyces sp. NPDC058290 TaxID=3346426 RepID=UPI0036E6FE1F
MTTDLKALLTALYVKIGNEIGGARWMGRPLLLSDSSVSRSPKPCSDTTPRPAGYAARKHLSDMFPYLSQRSGYRKRLKAALPLLKRMVGGLSPNIIGYLIVGLFIAAWTVAFAVWRFGRIEEKWRADLQPDGAARPERAGSDDFQGGDTESGEIDAADDAHPDRKGTSDPPSRRTPADRPAGVVSHRGPDLSGRRGTYVDR